MRVLNTDTYGRPVLVNGRMSWLTGREALQKTLKDRLQFFRGSCVFDRAAGMEASWIGGKGVTAFAQTSIRNAILETPDVVEILDMSISLDKNTRLLTGSIQVLSTEGSLKVAI